MSDAERPTPRWIDGYGDTPGIVAVVAGPEAEDRPEVADDG